jgi:hypothetical protein
MSKKISELDAVTSLNGSEQLVLDQEGLSKRASLSQIEQRVLDNAAVSSVNSQTGAVVLDADDIDDTSTTNKYTTQAEIDKLAGIEAGAEVNPTDAEIKTAYEANADTNAFTDAEQTKLAGIETGATGDQTGSEIKALYEAEADTNAFTDAEQTKLAGIETGATGDQTGSEIKTLYEAEADTNAYTDVEKSKLAGVESGATADQTGAEIKALYEAEADTNAFTDAEQTKLSGVETNADVTDEANVVAALNGASLATVTPTLLDLMLIQDNSDSNNLKTVDLGTLLGLAGGTIKSINASEAKVGVATTSATFVNASGTVTVTPQSSSSHFVVIFFAEIINERTSGTFDTDVRLTRNGTAFETTFRAQRQTTSVGTLSNLIAFAAEDFPNTGSDVSYLAQVAVGGGAGTIQMSSSTGHRFLLVIEYENT